MNHTLRLNGTIHELEKPTNLFEPCRELRRKSSDLISFSSSRHHICAILLFLLPFSRMASKFEWPLALALKPLYILFCFCGYVPIPIKSPSAKPASADKIRQVIAFVWSLMIGVASFVFTGLTLPKTAETESFDSTESLVRLIYNILSEILPPCITVYLMFRSPSLIKVLQRIISLFNSHLTAADRRAIIVWAATATAVIGGILIQESVRSYSWFINRLDSMELTFGGKALLAGRILAVFILGLKELCYYSVYFVPITFAWICYAIGQCLRRMAKHIADVDDLDRSRPDLMSHTNLVSGVQALDGKMSPAMLMFFAFHLSRILYSVNQVIAGNFVITALVIRLGVSALSLVTVTWTVIFVTDQVRRQNQHLHTSFHHFTETRSRYRCAW